LIEGLLTAILTSSVKPKEVFVEAHQSPKRFQPFNEQAHKRAGFSRKEIVSPKRSEL
jgi:hypothetical protein